MAWRPGLDDQQLSPGPATRDPGTSTPGPATPQPPRLDECDHALARPRPRPTRRIRHSALARPPRHATPCASTASIAPKASTANAVAIKATARELACLIYLMVTEGQDYVEHGIDAYEKRRRNRRFAHLDRQAQKLGFQLIPKTQGQKKQNPMPSIA